MRKCFDLKGSGDVVVGVDLRRAGKDQPKAVVADRPAIPIPRRVPFAVARETGRGWRIDKGSRSAQVDGAVALAMVVERAEQKPEPVRLLGWL